MDSLNEAIKIASTAHNKQFDKAGEPYIFHPLHLMMQCKDNLHRIVAVLHDVIEDSSFTLEFLKDYFSEEIIIAVDCLTHRKDEDYFDYIERIKPNNLACYIKCLDLFHNMDLDRLKVVTDEDKERQKKYRKAYNILVTCIDFENI